MKKANSYRKEIEFDIKGNATESFNKIVEAGLGNEFGIFKQSENHFTGGIPLSSYQYEGEGLPQETDNRTHHKEFNLNFDVRFSHDKNGNVELLVAKKGAGRHFKFPLKGLTTMQAELALAEFEQRMINSYIPYILYYIAWACYRKQDDNAERRKESFNKIISNLKTHFKGLFNRKRYKVIEEIEENGIKIAKSESIERGRNPQTKEEIEKQKQRFLEEIFEAFKDFRKSHRYTSPKQKDLRPYIYKKLADSEKKISEMLTYHKLDFTKLWQAFLSNPKKEVFFSAVIQTDKIGNN